MTEIDFHIIGIQIFDRKKEAGQVQSILTNYGCNIRTRLGLHDVYDKDSRSGGIIIIELNGDETEKNRLEDDLSKLEGVNIQKIVF